MPPFHRPTRPQPINYVGMDDRDRTDFRFFVLDTLRLDSTRAVLTSAIDAEYRKVRFYRQLLDWIEGARACPHHRLTVKKASGRMRYAVLCWACHTGCSVADRHNRTLWRLDTKETKAQPGYRNYHSTHAPLT